MLYNLLSTVTLFLLACFGAVSQDVDSNLLDPVPEVDFNAYGGLWLNALTSTTVWPDQDSSYCVRAKYTIISTDPVAMFSVVNEYNALSPTGEIKGGEGILTAPSPPTPQGSLQVSFAGLNRNFEYRIIKLSSIQNNQYTWAVIYSPFMNAIFVNYRKDIDLNEPNNDLDALGIYLNSLPVSPKIPLLTKESILSRLSQFQPSECDYSVDL